MRVYFNEGNEDIIVISHGKAVVFNAVEGEAGVAVYFLKENRREEYDHEKVPDDILSLMELGKTDYAEDNYLCSDEMPEILRERLGMDE